MRLFTPSTKQTFRTRKIAMAARSAVPNLGDKSEPETTKRRCHDEDLHPHLCSHQSFPPKSSMHLFLLSLLFVSCTASASDSALLTSYESVRSLDEYGNAVQIQHAQAAADQRGRLILALQRRRRHNDQNEPQVWVVSPAPQKSVHHRPPPNGGPFLLQAVTSPEPPTVIRGSRIPSSRTFLCCTGVQADAAWLLRQLREYGRNVAESYDSYQPQSVAGAVSQLKRQFWGYNSNNKNGDDDDEDDDDNVVQWQSSALRRPETSWGRPLGVKSLVVSCLDDSICMQLVEPSGIVRSNNEVWAMGKNSELLWQELVKQEKSIDEMDDDALKLLLLQAFREVLSSNSDESLQLQLEVVSLNGKIQRETLSEDTLL